LREVLSDLVDLGYCVEGPQKKPTFGIFSAVEVGATHKRERLFILAVADDDDDGREVERCARLLDDEQARRNHAHGRGGASLETDCAQTPTVADDDDEGLEGRSVRGRGCPDEWAARAGSSSIPWAPPGPDELDDWRTVLSLDPSLEPSLCRVAHGIPDRVDRLRALGNAVFPDTAANAFTVLVRRAAGILK
jgi:DNA (cytosine-5)-methyltransferase 1